MESPTQRVGSVDNERRSGASTFLFRSMPGDRSHPWTLTTFWASRGSAPATTSRTPSGPGYDTRHPDRGGDEAAFIRLCAAYQQILKDLDRRTSPTAGKPAQPPAMAVRRPRPIVAGKSAALRSMRRPATTVPRGLPTQAGTRTWSWMTGLHPSAAPPSRPTRTGHPNWSCATRPLPSVAPRNLASRDSRTAITCPGCERSRLTSAEGSPSGNRRRSEPSA